MADERFEETDDRRCPRCQRLMDRALRCVHCDPIDVEARTPQVMHFAVTTPTGRVLVNTPTLDLAERFAKLIRTKHKEHVTIRETNVVVGPERAQTSDRLVLGSLLKAKRAGKFGPDKRR